MTARRDGGLMRQAQDANELEQERSDARLPRADKLATGLIILLLVFFIAGTALLIWRSYGETRDRIGDQAGMSAQVVATNIEWVMESARQVLRRVDDTMGDDFTALPDNAAQILSDAVATLPGKPKIYVVDSTGQTLLTTDLQFQPIDVTDREYYAGVRDGAAYFTASLMVSRLNGEQIFAVSKRLERNGQFAGAAILSFNSELMEKVWRSLNLDAKSTVGLFRNDGMLVSRFPLPEGPLNLSQYVLFTDYLPKSSSGTYEAISPADGVHRIVGYETVAGSNLVALASLSTDAALATFYRNISSGLIVMVPVALALAYAAFVVAGLLRRQAETRERLAKLAETNNMLLREVHHRVKNNLQSVVSLINLQKGNAEGKLALTNRIGAMVAVHEHIYGSDQFADVDMAGYVPAIVDNLVAAYGRPVAVRYDTVPMVIDREHAMPLGLIINEVVSNALKYAFADSTEPQLTIVLSLSQDRIGHLSIADNGCGFDPASASKGMGSRLIVGLSAQISGKASYGTGGPGTTFTLTFPLAAIEA